MTVDELIEVCQALKAGKTIEHLRGRCWVEKTDLSDQIESMHLRVKPEPRVLWVIFNAAGNPWSVSQKDNLPTVVHEGHSLAKFVEVLE